MNCYDLLRQVDELLRGDTSSTTLERAPPISAWQPSPVIDPHSTDASLFLRSASPTVLPPSAPVARVPASGNASPHCAGGTARTSALQRTAVVQEAIDEVLDPATQAERVIHALLATARQNTDLTELDLVTRRIRQSEIEQLTAAIGLLEAQDKYLRKRCNILYDHINTVNDQQAVLVSCLGEALRASVAATSATANMSSSSPAEPGVRGSVAAHASGKTSSRVPDLDESSLPGSVKPGLTHRALQGTTSSASSLNGPTTAARVPTGLSTNRAASQSHAGVALQPANNSSAVSPYQVIGGALNRDMLLANILARR